MNSLRLLVHAVVVVWLALPAHFSAQTSLPTPVDQPTLELMHQGTTGGWSAVRARRGSVFVDGYLVADARPKPVVVLLQGSGCTPASTVDADGTYRSTSLFQDVVGTALPSVHFAMAEKRGVLPVKFTAGMTRAEQVSAFERASTECSVAFYENATKDARVADVGLLIEVLASQPWATSFILVGHSEGTHVATGVLKAYPSASIGAVGLFASAGPTPFWGGRYSSAESTARQEFERNLERLRLLQRADDGAMWDGLPARRWKTFWIKSTPIDDVRESRVPLFVAQGSRDGTLLPADLFVMEAIRQNADRPVRYVVLENGDHGFETPPGKARVTELFSDFLHWALASDRRTGTAILK